MIQTDILEAAQKGTDSQALDQCKCKRFFPHERFEQPSDAGVSPLPGFLVSGAALCAVIAFTFLEQIEVLYDNTTKAVRLRHGKKQRLSDPTRR